MIPREIIVESSCSARLTSETEREVAKIKDQLSYRILPSYSHTAQHTKQHSEETPKPRISQRNHLYQNPAAKHHPKEEEKKATLNPYSRSDRRSAPARPRNTFPRSSRSARAGRLDGLRVGSPSTTFSLSTVYRRRRS